MAKLTTQPPDWGMPERGIFYPERLGGLPTLHYRIALAAFALASLFFD